jgi:polyisoprenoid-binding protein YceI
MTIRTRHLVASLFALSLLTVACTKDVGEGKTKATVGEAKPVEKAAEPAKKEAAKAEPAKPAAATALPIDTARSKLTALGAKVTGKHLLEFSDWSGSVKMDGGNVAGLDFAVKVTAFTTDSERLANHLRSPDFFDVANHPEAKFVSTGITAAAGKDTTHNITGNLTLRGTTKSVTFPAKVTLTDKEARGTAEFVINRKDFKIVYPGKPDDLIQDNVVLTIDAVASR